MPAAAPDHGRHLLKSVDAIVGIGAETTRDLIGASAGTIEELLAHPPASRQVVAAAVSGVTEQNLKESLVPQARMLMLDGVSPELAIALVRAGLRTYVDLVAIDVATLTTRLAGELPEDARPDETALLRLQVLGARMQLTGMVLIRVGDPASGHAVSGAQLWLAGPGLGRGRIPVLRRADPDGWIVSPRLRRGVEHHGVITHEGYRDRPVTLRARGGGVHLARVGLARGQTPAIFDEAAGDGLPVFGSTQLAVPVTRQLSDLPEGTPLRVDLLRQDGNARLYGLWRAVRASGITYPIVEVDATTLPPNTTDGSTLILESGPALRLATGAERSAIERQRQRGEAPAR